MALADVWWVRLQFSFSNLNHIPPNITDRDDDETLDEYFERQRRLQQGSGHELLPETKRVDLSSFVSDLVAQGYRLVRAAWQLRYHTTHSGLGRYATVYYLFIHRAYRDDTLPIIDTDQARELIAPLVDNSLWRVRSFVNTKDDPTKVHCAFACAFRVPLFDNQGQPCTEGAQYGRDARGKRFRIRAAQPIQPNCRLRLKDRTFSLEST